MPELAKQVLEIELTCVAGKPTLRICAAKQDQDEHPQARGIASRRDPFRPDANAHLEVRPATASKLAKVLNGLVDGNDIPNPWPTDASGPSHEVAVLLLAIAYVRRIEGRTFTVSDFTSLRNWTHGVQQPRESLRKDTNEKRLRRTLGTIVSPRPCIIATQLCEGGVGYEFDGHVQLKLDDPVGVREWLWPKQPLALTPNTDDCSEPSSDAPILVPPFSDPVVVDPTSDGAEVSVLAPRELETAVVRQRDNAPTEQHASANLPRADKPRRGINRISLGALALISICILSSAAILYRWHVHPACIPMNWTCFQTGKPSFAAEEFGIIIEQSSFDPRGGPLQGMISALERRFQAWHDEERLRLPSTGPDAYPRPRVVAVRKVSDDIVRTSRALIGIAGQLEYSGSPAEYYFHDARAILNLSALSAYRHKASFGVVRNARRPASIRLHAYHYVGDDVPVFTSLVNGILGDSVPMERVSMRNKSFGILKVNGIAPQNLNSTQRDEISILHEPSYMDRTPDLLALPILASTSLKRHLGVLWSIRHVLDTWARTGEFDEAQLGNIDEYPELLRQLGHQLTAELSLLTARVAIDGNDAPLPCAQALNPDSKTIGVVRNWTLPYRAQYTLAAASRNCVQCYLAIARLMDCAKSPFDVIDALDAGVAATTGDDKARLVHQIVKYLQLYLVEVHRTSPALDAQFRRYLDLLKDLKHAPIADFEEGRWRLAGGFPSASRDDILLAFRRVLKNRPKHALTRLLVAKLVGADPNYPHGKSPSELLDELLRDDMSSSTRVERDALNSLGSIDDVRYHIPTNYLYESSFLALVRECRPISPDGIRRLSALPRENLERIDALLHLAEQHDAIFLFPLAYTSLPAAHRVDCPRLVSDAIQRVRSLLTASSTPGHN